MTESRPLSASGETISDLVDYGLGRMCEWESGWNAVHPDATVDLDPALMTAVIGALTERLTDNYPFFHPDYAGQMLAPPHPIAAAAYAVAQRINPNAHALDGGPATTKLEIEAVDALEAMFGYDPATSLGHLTSSGTIANLEALWVARELHPEKAIVYSNLAHYTHARMCQLLRAEGIGVDTDTEGRIDLGALEGALRTGRIGTVVATAGSTGIGAVDQVDQIVPLAAKYGARVHVDAAYGGYFVLLANCDALDPDVAAAYRAICEADSIVVDPHKRGLQPYGCGSVFFRDAAIGRFYKHDSPYTYFTSTELHLGEISLECSRAGAAAAALWATMQALPLEANRGLGSILARTRAAAVRWATLIRGSDSLRLAVDPALDIVTFYGLPADGDRRVSTVSALTQRVFDALMNDPVDPVYLATLKVMPPLLSSDTELIWDQPEALIFRSVLMKPEHFDAVPRLHGRVVEALGVGS
ncbi:MAG TPA: aminotransferase class V-fold PLP-dependent enzyme [Thermomicrobiales bacterium]|nr:aminotransferase class V-fold PLP-dependent enzyme [Thermomicrobiales bacterium]